MSDMMDTLKSLLGDDAEGKIKAALNTLSAEAGKSSDSDETAPIETEDIQLPPAVQTSASASSVSPDSIGQIMKLKSLAEDLAQPNDPRSQLLMSLRPYMRSSRQKSIDSAIKLLNLSKFSQLFR